MLFSRSENLDSLACEAQWRECILQSIGHSHRSISTCDIVDLAHSLGDIQFDSSYWLRMLLRVFRMIFPDSVFGKSSNTRMSRGHL
jgi:hypothetical protein